jgi:hypothetical protein
MLFYALCIPLIAQINSARICFYLEIIQYLLFQDTLPHVT